MVFVWSGDPAYTLGQVTVNDLLMLRLFAPIIGLLVSEVSTLIVPHEVLRYSVLAFILIPFGLGVVLRWWLIERYGRDWFDRGFVPGFAPVTITVLLLTLICSVSFQADNIVGKPWHVVVIVIPILLQAYMNASIAYWPIHWFYIPYVVAAPGALIGTSNFFELRVATAIALLGPESGASLATVGGVLIEGPVMLSICLACRQTPYWFETDKRADLVSAYW